MPGAGFAAIGAGAATLFGASAAMPFPLWRGINSINVICRSGAEAMSSSRLCDSAMAEARRGAPMPVAAGDPGDQPRAAVIDVALDREGSGFRLSLTLRRAVAFDDAESDLTLVGRAGSTDAVPAALANLLDNALPWRRPTGGIRGPRRMN